MLLNDIKQDGSFKKTIKIIGLVILVFLVGDACVGLFFTEGLNKYYGLGTDAEIALVGHSHLMLGVDKVLLEKGLDVSVAKYTREGVNIAGRQIMIRQLLLKNPKLETVIYGVDGWSFTGEGLSANSHTLFYPFLGEKMVDDYVKSQAGWSDYYLHKIIKTARYNELLISSSFRGYLSNWTNLKYGQLDTLRLKNELKNGNFRTINSASENIKILEGSINELREKNIRVILLYIPTCDLYTNAEPQKFNEVLSIFKGMENKYENVHFYNYLEPFSHDYTLFFDPIHLNPKGQHLVTNRLIQDLKANFH